jgi:hypothetical protein
MKYNNLGGTGEMKKNAQYSAGSFTVDEIGFIQIAKTKVLLAIARGEIDLNRIAREELAARGLGLNGEWVGFQKARTIHGMDK